eukprot:6209868-Pleurochrysis_carterae.AAC.2
MWNLFENKERGPCSKSAKEFLKCSSSLTPRPTYACAHDDRAHARLSHRGHAPERELVGCIVADSNTSSSITKSGVEKLLVQTYIDYVVCPNASP